MRDMRRRFTIRLSEDYRSRFLRTNQRYRLGYTSFTQFVRDCLRRRFEELDREHGRPLGDDDGAHRVAPGVRPHRSPSPH